MEILFIGDQPKNISQDYLDQLASLVAAGGQVEYRDAKRGIANAFVLAMLVVEEKVIAGCCLKNPITNYRNRVFKNSQAKQNPDSYPYELGYIVTHHDYEGKGHCNNLMTQFFPAIASYQIYATTRKPAMAHILAKYGFYKTGKIYKDDLEMLLYDGK
ncbi:hypothetical protein OQX63_05860 [Pedobacter sp. PF22-3]|uniref:hypothetical protein n=1 Tax=Pedobacter sp. PF22-3 TaxID=2994467 RepID=UPI002245C2A6|nr:hypothetical protein [Pedobacter sp. PF22-3]MCX2492988.1 hypothetical protein [Pedobacter sp. PF22-3]